MANDIGSLRELTNPVVVPVPFWPLVKFTVVVFVEVQVITPPNDNNLL